ncbi:Uncharacterized protein OBRU01_02758 [Operophtera brumata]|uniref:Uncharacterized protein n=1 Tax=Operophtera brumata TaxID=104452 RepID=A0A0L7LS35_OPEBR|nr:Uncharacterized protein OBRU01_02758 [Operophtera brumata]
MLDCAKLKGPCSVQPAPPPPPCPPPVPPPFPWIYVWVMGSFFTFMGLFYKLYLWNQARSQNSDSTAIWRPRRKVKTPYHDKDLPACVQYLIVFFITKEDSLPYIRPPLSKNIQRSGRRSPLPPAGLCSGSKAKNLGLLKSAPKAVRKKVQTLRTIRDLEIAYRKVKEAKHVVILGGGVLGTELAWHLGRMNRVQEGEGGEACRHTGRWRARHGARVASRQDEYVHTVIPGDRVQESEGGEACRHTGRGRARHGARVASRQDEYVHTVIPGDRVQEGEGGEAFRHTGRGRARHGARVACLQDEYVHTIAYRKVKEAKHVVILGGGVLGTELAWHLGRMSTYTQKVKEAKHVVILGGGVLGTELAWHPGRMNKVVDRPPGKEPVELAFIYKNGGILASVVPEYLGVWAAEKVVGEVGACMPTIGLFKQRGIMFYLRDETVVGMMFWNIPPVDDRKDVVTEV